MRYTSSRRIGCKFCGAPHLHVKNGGILVGLIRRKFFPERTQGRGEMVGLYRGRAQPLHGIATLGDCLSRLIDGVIESSFGFLGTIWQQVNCSLKAEQYSLKTLQ